MKEEAIAVGGSPLWERLGLDIPRWSIDALRDELASSPSDTSFKGELIFLRCPDRGYWLHTALERGYKVRATHPLESWQALQRLPLDGERLGICYEYLSPSADLQRAFADIGGILYFEVRCRVADPLAVEQALLETMDWVRMQMDSVDEVFARTRNLAGTAAAADCTVVFLKLANGIEGHCFFNALSVKPMVEVTFYGRSGAFTWGGGIEHRAVFRAETPAGLAATYRLGDWVEKASRFERSMAYGELKKL